MYYPGLDNVDIRTTIFLCDSFHDRKDFCGPPSEVCELECVPIIEAMWMIRQGIILDAMTIAGLSALCLADADQPPSHPANRAY